MADSGDTARASVLVVGQLFVDAVYSGLGAAPVLGRETWDPSFALTPGGIANHAITLTRLGSPVDLRAAIGTGPVSDLGRSLLSHHDLSSAGLTTTSGWDLPLTTSLSYGGDRALVTGGTPAPVPIVELLTGAAPAAVGIVHWDGDPDGMTALRTLVGTVIGDIGSDVVDTHGTALPALLEGVDVFVPNADEALAVTGAPDVAEALLALADHIPLPIITLGSHGVMAFDRATGERVHRPALDTAVADTTAAGDVFGAALALALSTDLPLIAQLDFAILIAGLSVAQPGGVSGAPTRDGVLEWLDRHASDFSRARFSACRAALTRHT